MAEDPKSFRWTERRAARFLMMVASGLVVVADVILLVVFLRHGDALPGGIRAYWYIPVGIALIFIFASYRFRRQLGHFLRDE